MQPIRCTNDVPFLVRRELGRLPPREVVLWSVWLRLLLTNSLQRYAVRKKNFGEALGWSEASKRKAEQANQLQDLGTWYT